MEILGIGPSELLFIIIIALIVLGPRDMQKAGKTVGRWLNSLVRSDGWKAFQQTSREIRSLPTRLMREANMEMQETERDIRKTLDEKFNRPVSSPTRSQPSSKDLENTIQPPSAESAPADPDQNEKNA